MEVQNITVDAALFTSRRDVHSVMQEALTGCEYYGHNLDALYDALTSLHSETHLTLLHFDAAEEQLGGYARRLAYTFREAEWENPRLTVVFAAKESEI